MSTPTTEPLPPVDQVLVDRVVAYVKGASRRAYVEECTGEALELLEHRVGSAGIPTRVWSRAVVEVAAELFHRQQAVAGVVTFDNGPEAPIETVRVRADPLGVALPLLRPYLGPAIA